jgi:hypothetical protein
MGEWDRAAPCTALPMIQSSLDENVVAEIAAMKYVDMHRALGLTLFTRLVNQLAKPAVILYV